LRSRLTAGGSSLGTVTLISALGICAATLAWELHSIGAFIQEPTSQDVALPVDRPLPHRHPARERKRSERGGDPVTAALERGVAAYNADDADAAADAFEEAVRLAPDEPEARINLGLVYLRLQRPEDAMRELAAGAALAKNREVGK
jgi:tetratricopeptide (TPR) repeat protein